MDANLQSDETWPDTSWPTLEQRKPMGKQRLLRCSQVQQDTFPLVILLLWEDACKFAPESGVKRRRAGGDRQTSRATLRASVPLQLLPVRLHSLPSLTRCIVDLTRRDSLGKSNTQGCTSTTLCLRRGIKHNTGCHTSGPFVPFLHSFHFHLNCNQ